MTDKNIEALLVKIMDLFAERFDRHAVLRGGMVLRVLGCERFTNDLDYVFVPFESKKDIVKRILEALAAVDGASVRHSLNSQCLRVLLTLGGVSIQIEVKVASEMPTRVLSTRELARTYGFPPRLIRVVDYPVALADKMAAWNERRLIRDMYDIWFFLKMGVRPDTQTLEKRLNAPAYSKLVKPDAYFNGENAADFFRFINAAAGKLTESELAAELSDYLPVAEIAGLDMCFRAEFAKYLSKQEEG